MLAVASIHPTPDKERARGSSTTKPLESSSCRPSPDEQEGYYWIYVPPSFVLYDARTLYSHPLSRETTLVPYPRSTSALVRAQHDLDLHRQPPSTIDLRPTIGSLTQ